MKKEKFKRLQKKLCQLLFDFDFTPPNKSVGRPEGNSNKIIPQSSQAKSGNSIEGEI